MRRINRPADPAKLSPGELADELGTEKAAIAERTERERALKNELIRRRIKTADGKRYRATISRQVKTRLNMTAVRAKLGALWCRRNSSESKETVVRVSARKRAA